MKYKCSICGYVYDDEVGIPELGIPPGTPWEDIPEDFNCPWCGAPKSAFEPLEQPKEAKQPSAEHTEKTVKAKETQDDGGEMLELNPMEASILCSNLARGCEKQYQSEQAKAFSDIAAYLQKKAEQPASSDFGQILGKIEDDLSSGFADAFDISRNEKDRGALRALTWSEKVTRILNSIVARYQKEGDAMFENTNIYVCSVCGFVFVGNQLPEVCPICKVTSRKFIKIEGGN